MSAMSVLHMTLSEITEKGEIVVGQAKKGEFGNGILVRTQYVSNLSNPQCFTPTGTSPSSYRGDPFSLHRLPSEVQDAQHVQTSPEDAAWQAADGQGHTPHGLRGLPQGALQETPGAHRGDGQ